MKQFILTLSACLIVLNLFAQEDDGPDLTFVEGGTYKMGSDESTFIDEYPDHIVTLDDFFIGTYEVTVEEYEGFCRAAGLKMPEGKYGMPATNVSWEEAVMFCNWLSRKHKLKKYYKIIRDDKTKTMTVSFIKDANGYRLPSEAEWEFAARGGNLSKKYAYSGSDEPDEVAWYMHNGRMLQFIGQKNANELGIYDMTGNCQEWVYDYYDSKYYSKSPENNPVNENKSTDRVNRGGNYDGHKGTLRVTKRFYNIQTFRSENLGFRIAKNK